MKRTILGGIMAIMAVAAVLVLTKSESKAERVHHCGKWVVEYAGQAYPVRCRCIASLTHCDCIIGDTTSDLSLCE